MTKRKKDPKQARQQIKEYFEKAQAAFRENKDLSNDYVRKARNIAKKHQLTFPRDLKRRFCKHCYSYLVPGKNLRIRTHEGHVVYYCLECKKFMRFPYKKNISKKNDTL